MMGSNFPATHYAHVSLNSSQLSRVIQSRANAEIVSPSRFLYSFFACFFFLSLNFPPACCCDTIISSNRWLNCCQALSIPRATVTMLGTEKSRLTACRIRFECNWNGQNAAKIVCQRDARVISPLVVSLWMLDNRLNEILGRNL